MAVLTERGVERRLTQNTGLTRFRKGRGQKGTCKGGRKKKKLTKKLETEVKEILAVAMGEGL